MASLELEGAAGSIIAYSKRQERWRFIQNRKELLFAAPYTLYYLYNTANNASISYISSKQGVLEDGKNSSSTGSEEEGRAGSKERSTVYELSVKSLKCKNR